MQYEHTQRGWIDELLYLVALLVLGLAWLLAGPPVVMWMNVGLAAMFVFLAFCFRSLTVRDDGERLELRFGPLPLFGRRLRDDAMTAVERGRTSLIDGWGIHYIPGRGTTYNLAGFDCVVVHLGRKTIRIGTDDADNLLQFLQTKVAAG